MLWNFCISIEPGFPPLLTRLGWNPTFIHYSRAWLPAFAQSCTQAKLPTFCLWLKLSWASQFHLRLYPSPRLGFPLLPVDDVISFHPSQASHFRLRLCSCVQLFSQARLPTFTCGWSHLFITQASVEGWCDPLVVTTSSWHFIYILWYSLNILTLSRLSQYALIQL